MKIDLFYELQMPRPWGPNAEHNKYWEAVEQIELADRAGFATVWAVEHHFLEEFSHCSAPEVFLSAVAQRTTDIRIGHGVVLLPWRFNHPIRVAERAAALDIMSKGRLEFGTGRSSLAEQAGFEIDPEKSREMWQEAMRVIPQMWMQERFSHRGRFFSIPERPIIPKPIQKPHPPMWVAATSPEAWELAGLNGLGCLGLTVWLDLPELGARMKLYRQGLERCTPAGAFVNDQVGVFTIAHCAETTAGAVHNGAVDATMWYVTYVMRALASVPAEMAGRVGGVAPYQDVARHFPLFERYEKCGRVSFEEIDERDMVIVGDPDKCIEKLKRYEQAGADHVLCLMQVGRLEHREVMKSVELFGKYVIPEFTR
jgi:alkanesulfonate monooxygenase SsuD/methylene tetrahydromethanopterin reductase-like flavin-dependent oxidoreductase (luciferase family)